MTARLLIRKLHRYLALVVALQLFFWSLGGFYFSIMPIDEIHGDHLVERSQPIPALTCDGSAALQHINTSYPLENRQIQKVSTAAGHFWKLREDGHTHWFGFCTGQTTGALDREKITELARQYAPQAGEISALDWITEVPMDDEFRGAPLPAYRVVFEGSESLHLYLDGHSGAVIAARTTRWRIFDFLWMLHVMDYEARDDFNHGLLQLFSALAIFTSLSGVVLWWSSRRRILARTRSAAKL